jgi:uncharacterized protein YidB (DUF937 family)
MLAARLQSVHQRVEATMGLLEEIVDNLAGRMPADAQGAAQGTAQGANPLLQMALQMLQQSGGLQGLLQQMQQAGFGDQVQSWIGTGQNQPISADALSRIFGEGPLGGIAQQLGMSRQDAAGGLAQTLPEVVDRMTPQGAIPAEGDDLVARALEMLQRGGTR